MRVTTDQAEGRVPVAILQMHGALDASSYRDLIATARQAYDEGARDILLDLSDTPFMSSAGLVALQSIAALLRGDTPPEPDAGWAAFHAVEKDRESGLQEHFKLLSPQPAVEQVLDLTGFKRFLEIHSDRETAVASF